MATITGSEGLFQITSITFSPAIIAFGESTSVSVTVKNISGKSVSSMYVTVAGHYQRSDDTAKTGYCAAGDLYLYGGPSWAMKSVSWANNASKTFTFDYAFTKGFYEPNLTSYIMTKSIFMTIVTGTTFSTGGNYDNFDDITSGSLTILSTRDNPHLAMTLDRATDGVLNDEGEALLTDLKLTADTSNFSSHSYSASFSCSPTPTSGGELNATIAQMISGITDSSSAITGTFNNGTNYTVTITVTNGYETVVATQTIARSFANVHMSGKSTGGVCFGGFSSATEGDPKFECYYPAYFYGGIHGDAYKDGDILTLTNGTFLGYVSNSAKSINFTVPLRKSLEKINTATITAFNANIANSGGYGISSSSVTGGSSYMGSAITRTVTVYKEMNCLEINLARSSAWDLNNNDTLSVRNESLVITLNE